MTAKERLQAACGVLTGIEQRRADNTITTADYAEQLQLVVSDARLAAGVDAGYSAFLQALRDVQGGTPSPSAVTQAQAESQQQHWPLQQGARSAQQSADQLSALQASLPPSYQQQNAQQVQAFRQTAADFRAREAALSSVEQIALADELNYAKTVCRNEGG